MSKFRTSRTRFVASAATVVLAALSLTACNDGTGVHNEGASPGSTTTANSSLSSASSPGASSNPPSSPSSSSSSSSSSSTSSTSSNSKPAPATTKPSTHTSASASKAAAGSGKTVTCEGSNTKTVAAPLNRPVNHMLLTVTNTGTKTCFLYGYPALRFTSAQAVPPVIEESQPQAVVTLAPGESGYASAALSATDGSGSDGYTAKSLTVYFYGRSMSGNVGRSAQPPLPAKGVYIDSSLKVTYWQQSMDDAINW